ncbi:MAG TPA: lytic murein transglycosylase [Candidatus Binatia bacterium]|nr:lytic murein transglycosylase [Candidatus Binatia bacterium]
MSAMLRAPRCLALCLLLGAPPAAHAGAGADKGWGPLIDRLVADGVARERAERVFADPRMPPFTGLEFSGRTPREPASRYRGFLRPAGVAAARRCLSLHADAFEAAAARGVPASVLAAIMTVESACGRSTGSSVVLYRLARLAMANDPQNLAENLARLRDTVEPGRVAERARYLEETFYPEVRATFTMADRLGLDPLDLRGSEAGAFGYPQFLPRNYLEAGVDGDGDGRVSLFDDFDAAASCANFLVQHGWRPDLGTSARRGVLWEYNRSEAYVDTVLTLARRIEAPGRQVASRRRPRQRARHHTT